LVEFWESAQSGEHRRGSRFHRGAR
jgi:hypothetical protein